MTIKELKLHLDAELQGDNAEYKLNEAFLYDALLSVLRLTKPRTHIVKEQSDTFLFKYFRRIAKDYWLRYPTIDLSDDAKIDMEEELCMAVVYFLCAKYSRDKKNNFKKDAIDIVVIYDTNVNFRANPRILGCYLLKLPANGDPNGAYTPNNPAQPIPILKKIAIAVADSVDILVENSAGGTITAISSSDKIVTSIKGNIVTITSNGEVEQAFVTIKGGDSDFRIEIFSAESDGGAII